VDINNNVWVTDVALHQIFKFHQGGGKALLTLGVAFMPGNDDDHFCKPTAVAVMSNGDFFVSDGYCNSRIMKFNKNGTFLMQWGRNSVGGRVSNFTFMCCQNVNPAVFYLHYFFLFCTNQVECVL
jgi:peptidylamidoglycolate lyase